MDGKEHIALGLGDWKRALAKSAAGGRAPLVRPHSECLTGDVFGSQRCDCGPQLREAVERIADQGGFLLYLRQEGRGIGLYAKLDAYALQEAGLEVRDGQQTMLDARQIKNVDEITLRLLGSYELLLEDFPAAEKAWSGLVTKAPKDKEIAYNKAWLAFSLLKQHKNAEALQASGAARMILQQDFTGDRLAAEIEKLVNAPEDLNRMEEASRKLAHGDSAAAAVDMIEELGHKKAQKAQNNVS